MPKRFNISLQDPASIARLVVAVLVLLNLVAAYFVMRPPGGSPDDLYRQAQSAATDLRLRRAMLERSRVMMTKIKDGRDAGDAFLLKYFLPKGTAYSAVYADLMDLAKKANIALREGSFTTEPVDGSDTLDMMTITQALEGKYADLIHFVNALDKSDRLLIVESLTAQPQPSGTLSVQLKLQTYVREDASRQ